MLNTDHNLAPSQLWACFPAALVGVLLLALLAPGCLELQDNQRPPADSVGDALCYSCHGDSANPDSAPPPAFWLADDYVDAHRHHLDEGTPCETCHVVPDRVDSPGHIDTQLPAELVWSGLAVADGATPDYDYEASTCDGVYCHGATLIPGGTLTSPNWTILDGSQADCGTCHGLPPDPPHPASDLCGDCHGPVIDNEGDWVDEELHVDGIVQVDISDCITCHGDEDSSAPPLDLARSDDTSEAGVGAHRAHLGDASWHREVTCDQCHVVPREVDDEGHRDGPPADIIWGDLASADDADPNYDFEANTCDGVYCHGATLEDGAGSNTEPLWTLVDGSQARCGTCHGLPPGGGHVGRTDCANCHGLVLGDGGFVNPDLHIDGVVQAEDLDCDGCHGGDLAAEPPIDTSGNRSTSEPGVGAHRAHLEVSVWHAQLTCDQCHVVPANTEDPGHNDTERPAELVWGDLAAADDADPNYDFETTTCDGVYCHGATLTTGGSNLEPDWTIVDGSQAECGTCHGLPPDAPHPASAACESCHSQVIDSRGFVDPDLHINGMVEVDELDCDSCHGLNGVYAPPFDTLGRRSTTFQTVGAHRVHLATGSIWRADIPCDECHVVPDEIDDPGHNNGTPADLTWGLVASARGADPSYSFETATCDGVYCHGGTMSTDIGASLQEPIWNIVDGTQAQCGTCHALPPQTDHPLREDCSSCHGSVVGDPPSNFVDPDLHINGTINF